MFGPIGSMGRGGTGRSGLSVRALDPALWVAAHSGTYQDIAGTTPAIAHGDPVGFLTHLNGSFHPIGLADDTTRPVLDLSGHPRIHFDGTDDGLRRDASLGLYASSTGYSIFAAVRGNPAANAVLMGSGRASVSAPSILSLRAGSVTPSSQALFYRNDANTSIVNAFALNAGAWDNTDRVVGIVDNLTSVTPYLDGVAGTPQAVTRSGTVTLDRFGLGAYYRTAFVQHWAGDVYELIAVFGVLSDSDRTRVIRYLAARQGRNL